MRRTLIGAAIGLIAAIVVIVAWPRARTADELRRELLEEVWPVPLTSRTPSSMWTVSG